MRITKKIAVATAGLALAFAASFHAPAYADPVDGEDELVWLTPAAMSMAALAVILIAADDDKNDLEPVSP